MFNGLVLVFVWVFAYGFVVDIDLLLLSVADCFGCGLYASLRNWLVGGCDCWYCLLDVASAVVAAICLVVGWLGGGWLALRCVAGYRLVWLLVCGWFVWVWCFDWCVGYFIGLYCVLVLIRCL